MPPECNIKDGRVPAECYLAIERAVESGNAPLAQKVDKIYNRMYIDNGKPCIQSVLESHKNQIKIQWYVLGALLVSIVCASAKALM